VSDPLEHLVDVLRQPGTPGELTGESHAVDALASSLTSPKGSPMKSSSGRRIRVASFIAAGVIGFGGVAAAGPGTFSDDSFEDAITENAEETTETSESDVDESTETTNPVTTTPVTTTPETTAPETTTHEDTAPPSADAEVESVDDEPGGDETPTLVDDPDTAFDERECADGNHGKTVSSVARTEGRNAEDVRDAAHSSCGKKTADQDDEGDEDESGQEDVDADQSAATDADGKQNNGKASNPGKGHGEKNGNGKASNPGKGHGKKND
jgi:hypothetical protein